MGHELHHIASFVWGQMWPNVFAPSFWTLMGIFISHRHHLKKQGDLLDPNTPGGLGDLLAEVKKEHEATRTVIQQNNA